MSRSPDRFRWALSTLLYVLGGIAAGFMAGGIGGRLMSSAVGVDQLADVLGGIGIGILAGAVITIGSARRLSDAMRVKAGVVLLTLAAALFLVLRSR